MSQTTTLPTPSLVENDAVLGALTSKYPDITAALIGVNAHSVSEAATQAVIKVTGVSSPTAHDVEILNTEDDAKLRYELAKIVALDKVQTIHTNPSYSINRAVQWAPTIVTVTVLLTFGVVLTLVLFHGIPQESKDQANLLLGTLSALASGVVSYWVGSTSNAMQTTKWLAESVPPAIVKK